MQNLRASIGSIVFVSCAFALFGCKGAGGKTVAATSTRSADGTAEKPADVAKKYLMNLAWRLPGPDEDYLYLLDREYFLREHRTEMIKTLDVAETVDLGTVAVSFIRYSIGSSVYRDAVYLRKVDDRWLASSTQFFSEFSDDPFDDGMPDRAKELIKRVENWKKESPVRWW